MRSRLVVRMRLAGYSKLPVDLLLYSSSTPETATVFVCQDVGQKGDCSKQL